MGTIGMKILEESSSIKRLESETEDKATGESRPSVCIMR